MKRLPRECYRTLLHYVLNIRSPYLTGLWREKHNAKYANVNGLEVWIVDTKTNGELWDEKRRSESTLKSDTSHES